MMSWLPIYLAAFRPPGIGYAASRPAAYSSAVAATFRSPWRAQLARSALRRCYAAPWRPEGRRYQTAIVDRRPSRDLRRWVIADQPEPTDPDDDLGQVMEVDWLDHVGVGAAIVTGQYVELVCGRGQDDHRQALEQLIALEVAEDLQAIELGHLEIEEDERRIAGEAFCIPAAAVEVFERFDPVGDEVDFGRHAGSPQTFDDQLRVVDVVVDQQHSCLVHSAYAAALSVK